MRRITWLVGKGGIATIGTVLEALGVSVADEELYLAILDHPGATEADLATLAQVSPSSVRAAAARLESRGLVSRSATSPHIPVAAPAAQAIEALVRHQLGKLESVAARYAARQQHAQREAQREAERGVPQIVEAIDGRDAVEQRSRQLWHSAQRELCIFRKLPEEGEPDEVEAGEAEVGSRTIKVRVVYDRGILAAGTLPTARYTGHAAEGRVAAVPSRLLIVDGVIALHSLPSGALVIHPSSLLDSLVALFERVWREATAVDVGGDVEGLDALDRQILFLLAAGRTENVVAEKLHVHLRTVNRRLHQMYERLGAQSRFEFAALVATRGWLGDYGTGDEAVAEARLQGLSGRDSAPLHQRTPPG